MFGDQRQGTRATPYRGVQGSGRWGKRKMGGGGGGGRSWEAGDRRSPRRSPECGIIVIGGVATIDTGTVGVWYGLTIYCVKFGFLVEQT
jgi:hypothetical protein